LISGLVVVDKPAGWTSHDVVARCRRVFGQKRVGHSGTLDPDATGVLLVGLGQATRLLRFLSELSKSYEGEVVLGTETSTLDAAGEVVATHAMDGVTVADVRSAAARLCGDIAQVPPMVSAVRVGGRRLHELARKGIEIDREPRSVHVEHFDVDATSNPLVFRISVECSAGTYVRVLASDLGRFLGGGAHLRALRRTAIGSFGLDCAHALDTLGPDAVLASAAIVAHLEVCSVDTDVAASVAHGRVLALDVLRPSGAGPWAVLDRDGTLLAVYEAHRERDAKPSVVLVADQ
jgi:tRNA pseudouridine55 synthase